MTGRGEGVGSGGEGGLVQVGNEPGFKYPPRPQGIWRKIEKQK